MPDLDAMLLRKGLSAPAPPGGRCGECKRTPLAGERVHELDSGRTLCELCFGALPDGDRIAVRSERVRPGARRLAVVPRAA